jgi:serine/threonine-protein kinase
MKHLSARPQKPTELRPDIPPELDMVILRALAKDPDERYQSADEMEGDLDRVARGAPVAATTVDAATQVLSRADTGATAATAATMIAPAAAVTRPPVVEEEVHEERGGGERPIWPWLLAAVFVIAAVVAGFFVWQELSGPKATQPVGLYTGQAVAQAEQQIRNAHLVPSVKKGPSEKVKPGFVFKQDPAAGSKLAKGSTVTIWSSTGPPKVAVPDVKGQQWPQAQQNLTNAGFVPVEHIVPGDTKGQVTATDPAAGQKAPKGSKVRVNVMSGPQQIAVPSVVGDSLATATAALHNAGFNVNPTYQDSNAPQNQVIHQNPSPGSKEPKGSTVDVIVSNGPPQVSVPDVVGYTSQQAVQALESAGFKVLQQTISMSDPSQNNIVQQQNPAGGSQATKGSTVTITVGVSSGPPPTTTGTTTTTG